MASDLGGYSDYIKSQQMSQGSVARIKERLLRECESANSHSLETFAPSSDPARRITKTRLAFSAVAGATALLFVGLATMTLLPGEQATNDKDENFVMIQEAQYADNSKMIPVDILFCDKTAVLGQNDKGFQCAMLVELVLPELPDSPYAIKLEGSPRGAVIFPADADIFSALKNNEYSTEVQFGPNEVPRLYLVSNMPAELGHSLDSGLTRKSFESAIVNVLADQFENVEFAVQDSAGARWALKFRTGDLR